MFFFRHPKPVIDGRAIVVQMVQQKATQTVSRTLSIVDKPAFLPLALSTLPPVGEDDSS